MRFIPPPYAAPSSGKPRHGAGVALLPRDLPCWRRGRLRDAQGRRLAGRINISSPAPISSSGAGTGTPFGGGGGVITRKPV